LAKRIVLIVSGETDRRSIPHLCKPIIRNAESFDVRKPPGNAPLTPDQAMRIVKAAWYEMSGRGDAPDKFVILVDTDAKDPMEVARPFEDMVPQLKDVAAAILVATAVRHLEAWFFGHAEKVREFLGRDLGRVDPTRPDEISNPKLHLIHLLKASSRVYTALVAEQIAARLDGSLIKSRSPSFDAFVGKLKNGTRPT
jgi:hypothetical protein